MKKWKLVIFDLDGTLIDTIDDLAYSVNHTLSAHGFPTRELSEYRVMVGNGMSSLVHRAMPDELKGDEELKKQLLADFLEYYKHHIHVYSKPYTGLTGLLSELSRSEVKLAVASNKIQAGTEALIGYFFPDVNFCAVCGGRDGFPLKPDPAVINYIMQKAGVSPEETVIVGDSGVDTMTARESGIESIGVTWGFRPDVVREEADYVVINAAQLRDLLL